jgi:hypothetical protein
MSSWVFRVHFFSWAFCSPTGASSHVSEADQLSSFSSFIFTVFFCSDTISAISFHPFPSCHFSKSFPSLLMNQMFVLHLPFIIYRCILHFFPHLFYSKQFLNPRSFIPLSPLFILPSPLIFTPFHTHLPAFHSHLHTLHSHISSLSTLIFPPFLSPSLLSHFPSHLPNFPLIFCLSISSFHIPSYLSHPSHSHLTIFLLISAHLSHFPPSQVIFLSFYSILIYFPETFTPSIQLTFHFHLPLTILILPPFTLIFPPSTLISHLPLSSNPSRSFSHLPLSSSHLPS